MNGPGKAPPKRVLFLAFHFPPEGGAGVQRSVKFVRYLREFGYESVVVTGPLPSGAALNDPTLSAELPEGQEVHRVPTTPPPPPSPWRGRAERWLRLTPAFERWWIGGAVDAARGAGDVDLVFATMSPFASALAAAAIARERGVPWVADLRDPWALDEMIQYPTHVHRRLAMRDMRSALASAAAVVMNTPEAAAAAERELSGLRTVTSIPNGFDPEDFADAKQRDAGDGVFRIVHTGHIHVENGIENRRTMRVRRLLGGSLGRVDILTRSHLYLLRALEEVAARDARAAAAIELHLAGPVSGLDRPGARSDLLRVHGYVPHGESVALLQRADLLFLPMHELSGGRRATIVPGKTYEYVASGRPILAAVPEGDARDLVVRAGTGFVCEPSDVESMARIVEERFAAFVAGAGPPALDREAIAPYARRNLANELARVFDGVLDRTRR